MSQNNSLLGSFLVLFIFFSSSIFSQVRLNEIQSSNSTTISDNVGEFDDWIEIYNPTDEPIDIGGLILKDQIDIWTIPTDNPSTVIPSKGYFILWADDQEEQGPFHTNFKIASGGEFIGLYKNDGVTIIDSITTPEMPTDNSLIKCDGFWNQTDTPSPLENNGCLSEITSTDLSPFCTVTINSNNELIVEQLYKNNDSSTITLYAFNGAKIIEKSGQEKIIVLNLNSIKPGVYIIQVIQKGHIYSQKISIR